MAKTIAKEIIIILLLCLAIILLLAVVLYKYIPNNKVVPEPVAYTAPDDVKQVLQESEVNNSQVILTYEFKGSDLSNAQRANSYNPGKINPFSSYVVKDENTGGENGTGTQTGGNNQDGSTNTGGSDNSGGTYYKDKGTK